LKERAIRRVIGGGIDQFVERLVMKNGRVTKEDWSNVVMLAEAAASKASALKVTNEQAGARRTTPPRGLRTTTYLKHPPITSDKPKELSQLAAERVLAPGITVTGSAPLVESILISAGPVQFGQAHSCVLFVNGNLKAKLGDGGVVTNSIVVCDGDVDIPHPSNSVVLARGAVRLSVSHNSVVLAGGNVTAGVLHDDFVYAAGGVKVDSANDCAVYAEGAVTAGIVDKSVVSAGGRAVVDIATKSTVRGKGAVAVGVATLGSGVERNAEGPSAFRLFPFFDPARLGIETALVKGELHVTKVHPGKVFAEAGLQADDVITAVDKARPGSVENFRKLLRRKEIAGRATLSVRRGDKTLNLAVTFTP
jgi:hypothetical protein